VCNLKCVDGEGFGGSFSRSRVLWEFFHMGAGDGGGGWGGEIELRFLGFGLRWEGGR